MLQLAAPNLRRRENETGRADVSTCRASTSWPLSFGHLVEIEQHLTLVFEEAFRVGEKPVTVEVIEAVLSRQIRQPGTQADAARL